MPSVNLSDLAEQHQKDMPSLIRYFVSSLGRDAASCADLMSYLLFTPNYTRDLIEIGYHDASERIDEIEDFLYSSHEGDAENALGGETAGNVPKAGSAAKRTRNSVRSRG
jgi:NTE family protein